MEYHVKSIPSKRAYPWILKKHYAHRRPSISYAFGLFSNNTRRLEGICTFGYPPNYNFNKGKCVFINYEVTTLELNRLVVNDKLPKNTLSYFVSSSLKLLPKPCCIVSYADPNQGHHGYIYQATNWIYSGTSSPKHRYIFEDGSSFDIRRGIDKKGKIVEKILLQPIYRYFYFLGNKTEVKNMHKHYKLKRLNYPKGDNTKYDASYEVSEEGLVSC